MACNGIRHITTPIHPNLYWPKSLVSLQSQAEFSPNVFRTMSGIGVEKNINTVLDCLTSFYHTLSIQWRLRLNFTDWKEVSETPADPFQWYGNSERVLLSCSSTFASLKLLCYILNDGVSRLVCHWCLHEQKECHWSLNIIKNSEPQHRPGGQVPSLPWTHTYFLPNPINTIMLPQSTHYVDNLLKVAPKNSLFPSV